jgi:molecular chaperone GrpE
MSKHHFRHEHKEENPEKAQTAAADGQNAATDVDSAATGTSNEAQNSARGAESAQNQCEKSEEQPAELTPEEKIAKLEAQLAETRDQLLRKAADFENFRKRMNQEKQSAIEYANQSLLLDIIPVIDDFERAIQSAEGSRDFTALLEGITMIEKRLTSQLESKWGLKRLNSAGMPFDPNQHEALMVEKSPDVTEAVVTEDLIKGYLLKDRVIRAAKVKVTMPENAAEGNSGAG